MNEELKKTGRNLLSPVVKMAIKLNLSPNTVTLVGLIITLLASYFYAKGYFRIAGLILLLAGLCDAIDGEVARKANKVSKFGAFFDSTIDRFEEFFVFGGILFYYSMVRQDILLSILVYLILLGSIMTSYIRARAEGIGFSPTSGPMDRPGRYIYIVLFSIIAGSGVLFSVAMGVLLFLVYLTVVNRFKEFRILISKEEKKWVKSE
uniref:CDP-alcohol phosphatidyltransferase family protein n=1 Tax=candidate division WOR-3 bacterium TaxID=2052148 RepID=A0A7V3KPL3_UNCW3